MVKYESNKWVDLANGLRGLFTGLFGAILIMNFTAHQWPLYIKIPIAIGWLYFAIFGPHHFEPKIKKYHYTGMIQRDELGKIVICGNKVDWLDKIEVDAYSEKEASHLALMMLNYKYPEYKDMVQIW